ncbi:hypothetical protein FRB94_003039 [Tulasnella sp. JGI-2019a]|nr:hypothetical protein FRB93_010880 [Tulasnella sp. JGI-2019a]KAG8986194.1 hypothetical protein FRB94_003039 [Tulasnella sp. JGI-2019a]
MSQVLSPNTRLVDTGDSVGYRWILTDVERTHIASLLNIEESEITKEGNIMGQDRAQCTCGKYSGLDDLVHNALNLGVHCKNFMLNVLTNGPQGPSPAHDLSCSNCGEMYAGKFFWVPSIPW